MTVRTTRTTISFLRPFKLRDLDDIQPADDYLLDTDEELIEGLSRLAYRRVATLLHLPSTSRPQSHSVNAPCTEPAMRPESWDALLAAIAKARRWIDDIRLGCIASFAEIAEREAQGRDRLRGFGGAAAQGIGGGTKSA